ncbi:hypothetical protein VU07_01250 [Desulfobulbus sp. F4]|nr:hypothetical protein [Desulfobulbus sp. F3]MCW5200431.1 hypothetical protein [Desulfobulbus sp. F4]
MLYFHYAGKINHDLPYIQLGQEKNIKLRECIEEVGRAFGGPYGIPEELHDSLGNYMSKENGKIFNFKDFCQHWILNKSNCLYLFKLIEFYCNIHLRNPGEFTWMISSLQNLCKLLEEKTA